MPINYLDAEQQKNYNQKAIYLNNWSRRVADMSNFTIPNEYGMQNTTGKYARFTGFVRCWVEELLATDIEDRSGVIESNQTIYNLSQKRSDLMENWWSVAQKVGNGKNVHNTLPKFSEITEENKQYVYDAFLPAYRAIKESFQKRSFFQFFFNHAQYVAERDSLRALEGIMTTLTGEGKEGIQARLDEYVAEIPSTDIVVSSRVLMERIQNQMREKAESAQLGNDAIELELVSKEEKIEEVKNEESTKDERFEEPATEEIDDGFVVYANNCDQLYDVWETDDFKNTFVADMIAAVKNECRWPNTMIEVYIETLATQKLITQAANEFNKAMDEAIIKGDDEIIKSVAVDGAVNVYAEAYDCAKALGLSLKDRLIVAQRFSNIVLNMATPVGFQPDAFGRCGDGFMLMRTDLNLIKEVVNERSGEKERFTDEEIEAAYDQAQSEFDFEMNRTSIVVDEAKEVIETNVVGKQEPKAQINPLVHNK